MVRLVRVSELVLSMVVAASSASGQASGPINLVQPKGTGRMIYQTDPAWKV